MAHPLMVPIIAAGFGLGYLLFGSKAKASPKSKVSAPAPKQPVFAPEPRPTPIARPAARPVSAGLPIETGGVILRPDLDVTNPASGAVHVTTTATGSEVFRKPDGGLVTVTKPVEVIGTPTPTEAQVAAGQGTDPGRGKRNTKAFHKWAQQSLNIAHQQGGAGGKGKSNLPKLDEDGGWGPKSIARAKEYQGKNGLQVDGVVGLNTEKQLITDSSSLPPYAFES